MRLWFIVGFSLNSGCGTPSSCAPGECDSAQSNTTSSTAISTTTTSTTTSSTTNTTTTTVPNTGPVVEISSPTAEGVYSATQEINFFGTIWDKTDDLSALTYGWKSSLDGDLKMELAHSKKGFVVGSAALSSGSHDITLYAFDPGGLVGEDTVAIEVGYDTAPMCEITTPSSGTVLSASDAFEFVGTVEEKEDDIETVTAEWTSDIDGVLYSDFVEASGETRFKVLSVSMGEHDITLTATDSVGNSCSDTINMTYGQSPAISFDKPKTESVYSYGETIEFEIKVKDLEDAPNKLALSWASNVDGVFSTQAADATGIAMVSYSALSIGKHVIEVTVTDSDGMFSSQSIDLEIL